VLCAWPWSCRVTPALSMESHGGSSSSTAAAGHAGGSNGQALGRPGNIGTVYLAGERPTKKPSTMHLCGEQPAKRPRLWTDATDPSTGHTIVFLLCSRVGLTCAIALGCLGIAYPDFVRSGWVWWASFALSCLLVVGSWGVFEGLALLPGACSAKSPRACPRLHSTFWEMQCQGRPKRLIFIRHGESEANVQRDITTHVPDHTLHLTARGREQSLDAGRRLHSIIGDARVRFIVSPYTRAVETLNGITRAWPEKGRRSLCVKEDVRLREQEFGNYDRSDMSRLHEEKCRFGPFYYRFPEGESPADCYDRASAFCESLYRSWEDNVDENWVIIGHGVMILVTLMRLLRFSVSAFDSLDGLKNCEFVVLERPDDDPKFHVAYTWCQGEEAKSWDSCGLRRKKAKDNGSSLQASQPVWNGDPDAPLYTSYKHKRKFDDFKTA